MDQPCKQERFEKSEAEARETEEEEEEEEEERREKTRDALEQAHKADVEKDSEDDVEEKQNTPPSLRCIVDVRERALIQRLKQLSENNVHDAVEFTFSVASLDVGDVQFTDANGHIHVAFERKTLVDMCASIKDGRYHEQKYRLQGHVMARGGKVVYLIEEHDGFGRGLRNAAVMHGLQPTALQSAVYGLMFDAGIFVIFTRDVGDTADAIASLWSRHVRRPCVAKAASSGSEPARAMPINPKRNKNITVHTCYAMQLCQIPGVSLKIAQVIAERWPTMADLYAKLGPLDRSQRVKAVSALATIGGKGAQRIVDHLFVDPPLT